MVFHSPWDQPAYKAKKKANPAKKQPERQHKKDVQFEAIRKDVSPKLKAAEKLLTKKTSTLLTEIAEGILERAAQKASNQFVEPIRQHYVPLVANLKAGFAETKRATTAMRSRSTKQRAYDQALADYRKAAWGVVENLLRASSLLHNPIAGPYPEKEEAFLVAWEELTEALRDARVLPIGTNPPRRDRNLEYRKTLESHGIEPPKGKVLFHLRWKARDNDWWIKTDETKYDGWFWWDDRTRCWQPSVYGPD